MAGRAFARIAAALCAAAAIRGAAQAQGLQRLTVESLSLAADTPAPRADVPFHLVVTLRVRERVAEVENLDLPVLAQLELTGDERRTSVGSHGTRYRETIGVIARDPGTIALAPVTLQAIDARDGKPKQWYSNALTLHVAGTSAVATGAHVLRAGALAALRLLWWLLLWTLGIGCAALIVVLLARRRPPPVAVLVSPSAPAPQRSSPRSQAHDALTVLHAQPTRAAAITVRAAIWRMVGAPEGETLGDVLRRKRFDLPMRDLLIALERSAFTYDADLRAAIADACSALERYIGSTA